MTTFNQPGGPQDLQAHPLVTDPGAPQKEPMTQAEQFEKGEQLRNVFTGDTPFYSPNEIARRAFFDDFAQLQSKIENPKRDAAGFHNNRYALLETILNTIRPLLNQHNFVVSQGFGLRSYTSHPTFGTFLYHKDGAIMSSSSAVPQLSTAQEVVSYSTYMRRVQLTAMLGIRDEDDDGSAASGYSNADGTPHLAAAGRSAPAYTQLPPAQPGYAQPQAQPFGPPGAAPQQQGWQPPQQQPQQAPPQQYQQQAPPPQQFQPQQAPPPQQFQPQQQQFQQQQFQQPPQAAAPPPMQPAPAPAPAPPAPAGALAGDMLVEGQNLMSAIEQIWGAAQSLDILSRLGLPDISHMLPDQYPPFIEQMKVFLGGQGKSAHADRTRGR